MDVENHEVIDHSIYIDNPMRVETMPVAKLVGIEVFSEILIEPKRDSEESVPEPLTFYKKLWFWFNFGGAFLICLALLTAFVLFLVWLNNPEVFGPVNY